MAKFKTSLLKFKSRLTRLARL